MKKTALLASALFCSSSFSISALASNFEGFSVELGAQYSDADFEPKNFKDISSGQPIDSTSPSDDSDTNLNGAIGYTFKLNDQFYLGLSYERSFGDIDAGTGQVVFNGVPQPNDFLVSKLEDLQSIIVSPGYALSESTLVSLRLGYTDADMKTLSTASGRTFSADLDGYLYGFGIQHSISDNLFVKGVLDVQELDGSGSLSDVSYDLDSSVTKASVSVGYRF